MLSHETDRIELVAALRWAARLGFQEGVDNHFSLAVPDERGVVTGERFLVNPCGMLWSEVTATSLVLCDASGEILEAAGRPDGLEAAGRPGGLEAAGRPDGLEAAGRPDGLEAAGRPDGLETRGEHGVEATAFFIHAPVHARGVRAVLHTHMPYATALTLLDGGRLEPCQQNALLFHGRIAYDDEYAGLALDRGEGERIAAALGTASVLMLGGHGVVTAAGTVAEAFADLYYLEMAARAQVLAMSTGRPLRRIPDAVVRHTAEQAKTEVALVAQRYFEAVKRTLRREEPEAFA